MSADMMEFPTSFNEFAKQYGFKDTEELKQIKKESERNDERR